MINLPQNNGECTCAESTGLGVHDCLYVARRNALIRQAEDFANREVEIESKERRWSRLFAGELDRLLRVRSNGGAK
jgi:hypothetical protein